MTITLLNLPYDIRHEIYTQLCPSTNQLTLHATRQRGKYVRQSDKPTAHLLAPPDEPPMPVALLRASRALHCELAAFLASRYVFNVVGERRDVLVAYRSVAQWVERHVAGDSVSDGASTLGRAVLVRGFGNGRFSRTMCVSVFVQAREGVVNKRGRGEDIELETLEGSFRREQARLGLGRYVVLAAMLGAALLALLVAWWWR